MIGKHVLAGSQLVWGYCLRTCTENHPMGSHDLRKCMCIGCIAEMTNAENACQGISDAAPDLLGLKFYEIKEAMESSCPAGRLIR